MQAAARRGRFCHLAHEAVGPFPVTLASPKAKLVTAG
jgi:hypothetical protein